MSGTDQLTVDSSRLDTLSVEFYVMGDVKLL